MENGAYVTYNASWCAKGQFSDWNGNWLIEGRDGSIVYEDGRITVHNVPMSYNVDNTEEVLLNEPEVTNQAYVLRNFMQAQKWGTLPQTDVFDNINSVAMVFAALRAVESSKTVPVLDRHTLKLIA